MKIKCSIIVKTIFIFLMIICIAGCIKKEKRDVTLTYAFWGDPEELKLVKDTVAKFENLNKDIGIKLLHTEHGHYNEKLQTLMVGGTAPDIMYLMDFDLYSYANKNTLLNLQPLVDRDKARDLDMSDFFKVLIDTYTYKGNIYALPRSWNPFVLYYNKDLFDKSGVSYPDGTWTWITFLNAAKKLTKDTDQDGFLDEFGFHVPGEWPLFVWQNKGKIFNKTRPDVL